MKILELKCNNKSSMKQIGLTLIWEKKHISELEDGTGETALSHHHSLTPCIKINS